MIIIMFGQTQLSRLRFPTWNSKHYKILGIWNT